jgi:4-amino-4-deoxy-L-arabinose transferase-like glycosyltransferase
MIALRFVWLDSDAYPRLSWSSALLTDEGFYLHNARNVAIFGHARTDDFNNMLIMPLLHTLQVGVFHIFGMTLATARAMSALAALLTLCLFWSALRHAYNRHVAMWGVLFLGLDHANLLYNRLALMDTPAALFLVTAFACYVRSQDDSESAGADRDRRVGRHMCDLGMLLTGMVLGVAYAVRGLAALLWPVPIVVWGVEVLSRKRSLNRKRGIDVEHAGHQADDRLSPGDVVNAGFSDPLREMGFYLLGLMGALTSYVLLWALPHHVELARVNHYYVSEQLVPQGVGRLISNIRVSCLSWQRGTLPYLARHMPVEVALVLYITLSGRCRSTFAASNLSTGRRRVGSCTLFLGAWLLVNLVFNCTVNYAPSRYYVLFYPALCGLAGVGLDRLSCSGGQRRRLSAAIVAIWFGWNGLWLMDWARHLTYRQRDTCTWLVKHLPPDSVVFGAVAPGLTIDSGFVAVNVIEDLCNDRAPLTHYVDRPRYILILDDRWKERWWTRHYPDLVAPNHRVAAFHGVLRSFFTIGLYPVPTGVLQPVLASEHRSDDRK